MDLLLENFVHKQYPALSDADKQVFAALLEESDPDLLCWLMGRSEPDNTAYRPLLAQIKSSHRDDHAG
ncbi:MAG: hypothetical protein HW386_752 [Gammaproteobacteria bacterium]|nr:hypothetical protein [Gammaproteobacteria bacterium]